jgi:hypothetical protein
MATRKMSAEEVRGGVAASRPQHDIATREMEPLDRERLLAEAAAHHERARRTRTSERASALVRQTWTFPVAVVIALTVALLMVWFAALH